MYLFPHIINFMSPQENSTYEWLCHPVDDVNLWSQCQGLLVKSLTGALWHALVFILSSTVLEIGPIVCARWVSTLLNYMEILKQEAATLSILDNQHDVIHEGAIQRKRPQYPRDQSDQSLGSGTNTRSSGLRNSWGSVAVLDNGGWGRKLVELVGVTMVALSMKNIQCTCTQRAHHAFLLVTMLPHCLVAHQPLRPEYNTVPHGAPDIEVTAHPRRMVPRWKLTLHGLHGHLLRSPIFLLQISFHYRPKLSCEVKQHPCDAVQMPSWPQKCRAAWSWSDSSTDIGQDLLRHLHSRRAHWYYELEWSDFVQLVPSPTIITDPRYLEGNMEILLKITKLSFLAPSVRARTQGTIHVRQACNHWTTSPAQSTNLITLSFMLKTILKFKCIFFINWRSKSIP